MDGKEKPQDDQEPGYSREVNDIVVGQMTFQAMILNLRAGIF
jgi:hypothetical protein